MSALPPSLLPRGHPFDYVLLTDRLRAYAAVRDRIGLLLEHREIVRVKKGLYIPGPDHALQPVDPLVLSGLVSGPSYVSFEKALALHGFIPERVEEITCATMKRHRLFTTPVGRFSYRPVPRAVFGFGVVLVAAGGGHYFQATPEKALCDCAAGRGLVLKQLSDVPSWLESSLRVDTSSLTTLRTDDLRTLARFYRRRPVSLLVRWLERNAN